ncbi:hypothetical protein KFE25_002849 [Diacronema lutheri]|uniref:Dilute domain-containing protein n=1 Tax=Diacronema lutheri TaxID=2081491 RepID=A0A8J5XP29_DIALT|nr:hypothetical protein KFE25_002849 [Diacronema lutheri]
MLCRGRINLSEFARIDEAREVCATLPMLDKGSRPVALLAVGVKCHVINDLTLTRGMTTHVRAVETEPVPFDGEDSDGADCAPDVRVRKRDADARPDDDAVSCSSISTLRSLSTAASTSNSALAPHAQTAHSSGALGAGGGTASSNAELRAKADARLRAGAGSSVGTGGEQQWSAPSGVALSDGGSDSAGAQLANLALRSPVDRAQSQTAEDDTRVLEYALVSLPHWARYGDSGRPLAALLLASYATRVRSARYCATLADALADALWRARSDAPEIAYHVCCAAVLLTLCAADEEKLIARRVPPRRAAPRVASASTAVLRRQGASRAARYERQVAHSLNDRLREHAAACVRLFLRKAHDALNPLLAPAFLENALPPATAGSPPPAAVASRLSHAPTHVLAPAAPSTLPPPPPPPQPPPQPQPPIGLGGALPPPAAIAGAAVRGRAGQQLVIVELGKAVDLLLGARVPLALVRQAVAALARFVCAQLLNAMLHRAELCTSGNGVQLKLGVSLLEGWVEATAARVEAAGQPGTRSGSGCARSLLPGGNGVARGGGSGPQQPLAIGAAWAPALDAFAHVRQAADILIVEKAVLHSEADRRAVCPALHHTQVARLLRIFQPDEWTPEPPSAAEIDAIIASMHASANVPAVGARTHGGVPARAGGTRGDDGASAGASLAEGVAARMLLPPGLAHDDESASASASATASARASRPSTPGFPDEDVEVVLLDPFAFEPLPEAELQAALLGWTQRGIPIGPLAEWPALRFLQDFDIANFKPSAISEGDDDDVDDDDDDDDDDESDAERTDQSGEVSRAYTPLVDGAISSALLADLPHTRRFAPDARLRAASASAAARARGAPLSLARDDLRSLDDSMTEYETE